MATAVEHVEHVPMKLSHVDRVLMKLSHVERVIIQWMREGKDEAVADMKKKYENIEGKYHALTRHCRWLEAWNDSLLAALHDNNIAIPPVPTLYFK